MIAQPAGPSELYMPNNQSMQKSFRGIKLQRWVAEQTALLSKRKLINLELTRYLP